MGKVSASLQPIFEDEHRQLRPRTPVPEFRIEFFPFANANHSIRLREQRVLVRLSDLLENAPVAVLQALAHILLAKLYREPVRRTESARYRRHLGSAEVRDKVYLVRQLRGRKEIRSARGHIYDLETIFKELNTRYFFGLLARPRLTWSRNHARRSLAHFDPGHNTIVVSRVFDSAAVPRFVVEYIVYHEMLHLKHPVKQRGSRRCVHSREFRAEEKLFAQAQEAQGLIKQLAQAV